MTNTRCGRLHHELCRGLVEACAIPSPEELQARLSWSRADLDRAFEELAEGHGVVLHPASHRVWAIHPFSLAPSPFLVESDNMMRAWDNVVYTCSMMLLFKDEEQVAEWSARHRIPRGDIQPVTTVLELAKRWYGEHLRPDWKKKSMAEARAIFLALGLVHPVWSLPSDDGRF